ncbi:MAG: hypothetical protein ACTHN8_10890 [Angustibacter sp.]
MKLSPLPVRRPSREAADVSTVDLTAAEAAPRPAALDEVLDWLKSLES